MSKYKNNLKEFFSNKFLLFVLSLGIVLNLSAWLVLWSGLDLNKTTLIIHYNAFFGIDKISLHPEGYRFLEVFFAPLSGLSVVVINYLLGLILLFSSWKKSAKDILAGGDKKISTATLGGYFILLSGIVLQMVILVYTISIVMVNK
jgi:hypothetical protein